jgi:hypothetical protein
MMGSERLKKDSVVSIINSQTNSSGAVQQVSVSNFSQQGLCSATAAAWPQRSFVREEVSSLKESDKIRCV